jgi:quercetin dioxygenase-like cupin family protein
MDSGLSAKIYVALAGEITIELGTGDVYVLGALDSCFIAAGEARAIRNEGNVVATMLVVMPYPETQT